MKSILCFSPAHITGFFSTHYDESSLLKTGSIGAGFSIEKGVFTRLEYINNNKQDLEIYINDKKRKAPVSAQTFKLFFDQYKIPHSGSYRIYHQIDVPIGCGFGTSGAGALSLSLALHKMHELDKSIEEVAKIAHKAEVFLKTGLGTVTAETYGGMEIRISPGAPGCCKLDFIDASDYTAGFCVWGKTDTSKVLKNQEIRSRINKSGRNKLSDLLTSPDVDQFMKLSYTFSKEINMFSTDVQALIEDFYEQGFFSAMLMFGDGVFIVFKDDLINKMEQVLEKYKSKTRIIYSKIETKGVRVID